MTLIDIGRFITVLIIALIILVLIIPILIMMKIMASGMMAMRREDSDTAVPPSNIGPSWAIPPHLVVTSEIKIIVMVFLLNILVLIITTFCVTRPKPAYGRQGLDWIAGPEYSFTVFSM